MCIASGKPFLGIPTTQGRVLYLDYENNIDQIVSIAEAVAKHLGLRRVPDDFQFWSPASRETDNISPLERIRKFRPGWSSLTLFPPLFPKQKPKTKTPPSCTGIVGGS